MATVVLVSDNDDDGDVIDLESPIIEKSNHKRKHHEVQDEDSEDDVRKKPRHPLLDSITQRFDQNKKERELKEAVLRSKREMEKVHSRYLQSVLDPADLARAKYAAGHWAKKNGLGEATLRQEERRQRNNSTPGRNVRDDHVRHSEVGLTVRGDQSSPGSRPYNGNHGNRSGRNLGTEPSSEHRTSTRVEISSPHSKETNTPSRSSFESRASCDTGTSKQKFVCPVLYCEANFSSDGALGQHLNLFKHSPCNPCRLAKDCKLSPDPLCFMCPQCDVTFPTRGKCMEHMNAEDHMILATPLTTVAYMCPQCVHLFEDFNSCWMHMEHKNHHKIHFPFSGDDKNMDVNIPAPVTEELAQDFIRRCKKIPFHVQCLDCDEYIANPALMRQHERETNKQHQLAALTSETVVDVFSRYLEEITGTSHSSSEFNMRTADTIKTFAEFLRQCAVQMFLT